MRPVALLVVPAGVSQVGHLADAVHRWNPDWGIEVIWAGDPHLRPALPEGSLWFDPSGEVSPLRQRQLVSRAPLDAVWLRAIAAARHVFRTGTPSAVVLVAGSVAVLGPLDVLVPASAPAMLVPRVLGSVPEDGCVPTEADLIDEGSWSTSAVGLSAQDHGLLDWWERQLSVGDSAGCSGRVLDRAAVAFGLEVCSDPAVGIGEWRWTTDAPLLLDLPRFSITEPWTLNPDRALRARVDVATSTSRQEVLERAAAQLGGAASHLSLPGGLEIDPVLRAVVADADADPPPPWTSPGEFRAWLGRRYWTELPRHRPDLAMAFPDRSGRGAAAYLEWCRRAFVDDHLSVLVAPPTRSADGWPVASVIESGGVNLVGYLTKESSLGDVGRRLWRALDAGGVPVEPLAYARTASPEVVGGAPAAGTLRFDRSVVVVNADQFHPLSSDHPELFSADTRLIGYWFWELALIPPVMIEAATMVDEVWVGSTFVAEALGSAIDRPVRCVPIPVGEPVASARTRRSFPMLAHLADRFIFAAVFDHFSVTERKNPIGVINAFRRAFAPDEGPALVIKSMNGDRKWPDHQRIVAAAAGRPDIVVWDEHLDRADHMALIRSVDALVSLHRSEGLGLHLAEAMWLGTPVIATRYSGNLDFMDDECSLLIDARLVPVERGEGIYPPEAYWADPDLDQAAAAMRRLVADPDLRTQLSTTARGRMTAQRSAASTGRDIAALLGIEMAD